MESTDRTIRQEGPSQNVSRAPHDPPERLRTGRASDVLFYLSIAAVAIILMAIFWSLMGPSP